MAAQLDTYNLTVMTAVREVENAMTSYSSSLRTYQLYEDLVKQTEKTLELSLDLYKQGLSDFTNVMNAQISVLDARNSAITAHAAAGCLVGVFFMNQSVSIYTQIGLILLLGMAAKNAILIVEYARDYRKAGQPILQAAHDAGVVRFRPIMMTALAFIFGVMPMLFATGAGAESRREIGTAIVFGMTLNAIIGTLMVPTFWYILQSFYEKHLSNILKFPNLRGKSSAAPPSGAPAGRSSPSKTTGADTSSDTSGTSDSSI